MSAFYDTADAITTRLEAVEALAGVSIVVDRQRDIAAELTKAIGRQTGKGLLVVTWTGGANRNEAASSLRLDSTFTVTGFFKPVIRAGQTAADDIMEAAAKALHDWPPGNDTHFHYRVIVKGIDPIQHPELLAMRMNLSCSITI